MKLQEGGCGVAGTFSDFAGIRSLGDAEQQADLQIPPEEPRELLGKFSWTSCEQSGCLCPGHDFAQGAAASLACYRVKRTRYFGGVGHLGDRQSEYGKFMRPSPSRIMAVGSIANRRPVPCTGRRD